MKLNTPLGEKEVSKGIENLFATIPTVGTNKQNKSEYALKDVKIKWYEEDGKTYCTIERVIE